MNREIKFRAWDKTKNNMVFESKLSCFFIKTIQMSTDEKNRFEIMQYTGLKDKNGIEIYEGDITRVYGGEYCQGYYEYDSRCVVKWQSCGFDMVTIEEGYGIGWCFCDNSDYIEVIGNIYENPELLNKRDSQPSNK